MFIKTLPASERPQEKLLYAGPGALSNSELIALLIRTGTKEKSSIGLAEDLIASLSTGIGDLGRTDVRELMNIGGIGAAKACSIAAAIELGRRLAAGCVREFQPRSGNPDEAAKLLMQEMMYEKREIFMALFLNTRLEIESKAVISIGNLDAAPVHPREVFSPAIKRGAAAVIVSHNHPSGNPDPSEADYAITRRLEESADLLGIRLLDHIIIGKDRYVSLREEGFLS